jgi:hypothetical protein
MRHRGTLRPDQIGADAEGWLISPDLDPDRPFQDLVAASADDLWHAGVAAVSGLRINLRRQWRSWRELARARRQFAASNSAHQMGGLRCHEAGLVPLP